MRPIPGGFATTVVTCLALGVATPVAGSPTSRAVSHTSAVASKAFPHCVVGTWRDGHEQEFTEWANHKVTMHYTGGDIDHISAKGVDKDNWKHAHAEHGKYQGSTLTEVIRGVLTEHMRAHGSGKLRITSGSWSPNSSNRYTYRGEPSTGYLNRVTPFTFRYTCTAKKLTYYNKKGQATGVETRISREP